ncbi:MAG: hypothetical protein HYV63_00230 [Candidatus Schekmanbacteria bacterium]|nr:hypothetical protein [Candidatus Schekmanbacteria bacterium]
MTQQAHSREWLGLDAAPGNGELLAELSRSCERIDAYLLHHQLQPAQAIVRLDGAYGRGASAQILREAGVDFLLRCTDYRLLDAVLQNGTLPQLEPERFEPVDSNVARQLYEVGMTHWPQVVEPPDPLFVRLIVSTRRPQQDERRRPKIGKRVGSLIYELFATSLPPRGFMASDVLSLYLGRGGFESTLWQEDLEQSSDRWVFTRGDGEALWQVINQWIWNPRLQLGLLAKKPAPRCILWAEALASRRPGREQDEPIVDLPPVPPPLEQHGVALPLPVLGQKPLPATTDPPQPRAIGSAPASAAGSSAAQPTVPASADCKLQEAAALPPSLETLATVTSANGRGAGRFAAADFTWRDPRTLLCPAGKPLRASERRAQPGQERIRFEARAGDCRACALAHNCLGGGSSGRRGRRVSVVPPPRRSSKLPGEVSCQGVAMTPNAAAERASVSTSTAPARAAPARPAPAPGPAPLLWVDLPAAALRRFLPALLLLLRFDLVPPLVPPISPAPPAPLSRAQVAHRRLTYRAQAPAQRPTPEHRRGIYLHSRPAGIDLRIPCTARPGAARRVNPLLVAHLRGDSALKGGVSDRLTKG